MRAIGYFAGLLVLLAGATAAQPLTDPCTARARLATTVPDHPMIPRLGAVCDAIGPRFVTPSCMDYYLHKADPALPAPAGGIDALARVCDTEMPDGTQMAGWRERWIGFTAGEAAAEAMFYQAETIISEVDQPVPSGFEPTIALAKKLYLRAAELGNPVGWIALGDLAEYGTGQPVDKVQALEFFARAWNAGLSEGAIRAMAMAAATGSELALFDHFIGYYRLSPPDALDRLDALGKPAVAAVQRQLFLTGHYGGQADGSLDDALSSAVDAFIALQ